MEGVVTGVSEVDRGSKDGERSKPFRSDPRDTSERREPTRSGARDRSLCE